MHRQGRRAKSKVLSMSIFLQDKIRMIVYSLGCDNIIIKDAAMDYKKSKKIHAESIEADVITQRAGWTFDSKEFTVDDGVLIFTYDYCIYQYCKRFGTFGEFDYIENRANANECEIMRFAYLIKRRLEIDFYKLFNKHYIKIFTTNGNEQYISEDEIMEYFICFLSYCLLDSQYNYEYQSTEKFVKFVSEKLYDDNKYEKERYNCWLDKIRKK